MKYLECSKNKATVIPRFCKGLSWSMIQRRCANESLCKLTRQAKILEIMRSYAKVLRWFYHFYNDNKICVYGTLRCVFSYGSKIAALNFRMLFRYGKGYGCNISNPEYAR